MNRNYIESILGFLTLIVATAFFLNFLDVNSDKQLSESYTLKAKFLKVGGILIGNDVKMRGVKIGVVNNVELDSDYFAVVEFQIYSNIKIPENSSITVQSDGILGNKYLSITPSGKQETVLESNKEIKQVIDFESIEDQVSKIIFLATQ